jgi:hypothetical protein
MFVVAVCPAAGAIRGLATPLVAFLLGRRFLGALAGDSQYRVIVLEIAQTRYCGRFNTKFIH